MTDTTQVPHTSEDQVPFKALETDFAKRICKIAGVKKLSELLRTEVQLRTENSTVITTVTAVEHMQDDSINAELICLSIKRFSGVIYEIRLYDYYFKINEAESVSFPSGIYTACTAFIEKADDISFEPGPVGIGPHNSLLVTGAGQIADIEGVTGVAKITG